MGRKAKYTPAQIVALCEAYVKDSEHFTGFGAKNVVNYYKNVNPLPIELTYLDIRRCKEAADFLDNLKGRFEQSFCGTGNEIIINKEEKLDINRVLESGNKGLIRKTMEMLKKQNDTYREREIDMSKELSDKIAKCNEQLIFIDAHEKAAMKKDAEIKELKKKVAELNRINRDLVKRDTKIMRYLNDYVYPGIMQAVFAEQGLGTMEVNIPPKLAELLSPTGIQNAVSMFTSSVLADDEMDCDVNEEIETVDNNETTAPATDNTVPWQNYADKFGKL